MKNYEQYKVDGLKFEYFPTNVVPVVQPNNVWSAVKSQWTYEDPDTYNTAGYAIPQIMALDSFKAWNTNRPMKVYRNNAPLAKKMKSPW